MPAVRVLPWVSVQPSLFDVIHDVRYGVHGTHGKYEDVWATVSLADQGTQAPGPTREHGTWRVSRDTSPTHDRDADVCISSQTQSMHIESSHSASLMDLSCHGAVELAQTSIHVAAHRGHVAVRTEAGTASSSAQILRLSPLMDNVQRYAIGAADGVVYAGVWEGAASLSTATSPEACTQVACRGHQGDITSLRFFPSAQVILSTSLDMRARIFSALDGTNPRTLEGHTRAVTSSAILGRGREVATGSWDETVRLWDVGQNTTVSTWHVHDGVCALEVLDAYTSTPEARHGVLLAGTDSGRLCVWDVREPPRKTDVDDAAVPVPHTPLSHTGTAANAPVHAMDVHSTSVLVGMADGVCAMYDMRQWTEPVHAWCRNTASVTDVRIDPSGTAVMCATSDGLPYSLDLSTWALQEYTGWDTERTTAIERDARGRTIVLGHGTYALYDK